MTMEPDSPSAFNVSKHNYLPGMESRLSTAKSLPNFPSKQCFNNSESFVTFPAEILYQIVSYLLADFIDIAIVAPSNAADSVFDPQYHHPDIDALAEVDDYHTDVEDGEESKDVEGADNDDEDDEDDAVLTSQISLEGDALKVSRWEAQEASEGLPENFVAPLLCVSYQFRETTFKVLTDVLGTKRDVHGSLSGNLWTHVKVARRHFRIAQHFPPECYIHSRNTLSHLPPLLHAYFLFGRAESILLWYLPLDMTSKRSASIEIHTKALRCMEAVVEKIPYQIQDIVLARAEDFLQRCTLISTLHEHSIRIARAIRQLDALEGGKEDVTRPTLMTKIRRSLVSLECGSDVATPKSFSSLTLTQIFIQLTGVTVVMKRVVEDNQVCEEHDIVQRAQALLEKWSNFSPV